jgi:hypothetical protein
MNYVSPSMQAKSHVIPIWALQGLETLKNLHMKEQKLKVSPIKKF